jgi:hypothetical protein
MMSEVQIKIDQIKLVLIDELVPNPKNRNQHSQDQVEELARHYKVQGMRTPIIVSNQSGFIVAGHGRYLAAIRAGLKEVPVSFQDFKTPAEEYAFGIADNGLGLWSRLDFSAIHKDVLDLGPDFQIDDLGIHNFTLDMEDSSSFDPDADDDEKDDKIKTCPHCGEPL